MDQENLMNTTVAKAYDCRATVQRLRAYDPQGEGDVDDPYYGGDQGFEINFAQPRAYLPCLYCRAHIVRHSFAICVTNGLRLIALQGHPACLQLSRFSLLVRSDALVLGPVARLLLLQ